MTLSGFDTQILKSLITALKETSVKSKISIFNQIALLGNISYNNTIVDYNLSRYGPSAIGTLAVLFVLKSLGKCEEAKLLMKSFQEVITDELFWNLLRDAEIVAKTVFNPSSSNSGDSIDDELTAEESGQEVYHKDSQLSGKEESPSCASNSTVSTPLQSMRNTSIPPIRKLNNEDRFKAREFEAKTQKDSKLQKMLKIKHKVIRKRML